MRGLAGRAPCWSSTLAAWAMLPGLVEPQDLRGCAAVSQIEASYRFASAGRLVSGVPAATAYECLAEVPLHASDARSFLKTYRQYLQFQSTLAYLKNPPAGYQWPAVDLMAGLTAIEGSVNASAYAGQYAFDAAVMQLVDSAYDGHLFLVMPTLSVFSFYPPLELASVSSDGKALPQIYAFDDVRWSSNSSNRSWTASPLTSINGQEAVAWLTNFSSYVSSRTREPHAAWNTLFASEARRVEQGVYSELDIVRFWPGSADFDLAFANGSTRPGQLKARYDAGRSSFADVKSGEDFYRVFAAPPASGSAGASAPSPARISPPLGRPYPPDPIVAQRGGLGGADAAAAVSGYFLDDSSTAVLVIPSFNATGAAALAFSEAVADFVQRSKQAGMRRMVIDLRSNRGGMAFLGLDTIRHFFPSLRPYMGSQYRAHGQLDLLGYVYTLEDAGAGRIPGAYFLDAKTFLTESGGRFDSWFALYGPVEADGDNFTHVTRWNYADARVDEAIALFDIYGFGNRTETSTQAPYAAEDLVLLTDGICHSACASFAETMTNEVGVRTVVVGGRPSYGAMQAVAGTRGLSLVSIELLSKWMAIVRSLTRPSEMAQVSAVIPPLRLPFNVLATFNMQNALRRDSATPLQFQYEAANCRIFFTREMFADYRVLWQAAASFISGNSSLCV